MCLWKYYIIYSITSYYLYPSFSKSIKLLESLRVHMMSLSVLQTSTQLCCPEQVIVSCSYLSYFISIYPIVSYLQALKDRYSQFNLTLQAVSLLPLSLQCIPSSRWETQTRLAEVAFNISFPFIILLRR